MKYVISLALFLTCSVFGGLIVTSPPSTGTGSTNIVDNGYAAEINNATVKTNLTVDGTLTAATQNITTANVTNLNTLITNLFAATDGDGKLVGTLNGAAWTNLPPVNIATNLAGASGLSAITYSNSVLQFRNTAGGGTNIMYVDPATGALLWNADVTYSIGSSTGNRPKFVYANAIQTTDAIYGGGEIRVAASSKLYWNNGSVIYSPANGSIRVTDTASVRDRLYIYGANKALNSGTTNAIFQLNSRTNLFVGGTIDYTIFCLDASSDCQALSGIVTFAAVNKLGVWTTPVVTEVAANQSKCLTTGTLTAAWTGTAADTGSSTNALIIVTPTTSLTPNGATNFFIQWQMRVNSSTNVVTAL